MIRFLSLLSFILFLNFQLFSNIITENEALIIAKNFTNSTTSGIQKAPSTNSFEFKLAYTAITKTELINIPDFYVYNKGTNNGFIIVSANDRAKPILGYSDSGSFDYNLIPENFRKWLITYTNEISALSTQHLSSNVFSAPVNTELDKAQNNFASSVSPLLKTIKWNQNSPFNDLSPIVDTTKNIRAAAGCVATAMAQIMKYHEWPNQGTGSNSYISTTLKFPLNADFSKSNYNWTLLTNTYNTSSTLAEKVAIAKLLNDCAVSVNMDFNYVSSAYTTDLAKALINYFNYDTNLQVYMRDYYEKTEWEKMLKTELNAFRPVIYNGQASDGGHLFICDGYDSNGLYHFNWGWGGVSDGYFELSALNPQDLGIGGGNSGGYNTDQYIVIGIQKPTTSSVSTYNITTRQPITSSVTTTGRTSTFTITSKEMYNKGINIFSGSLALGLYSDGTLVQVIKSNTITDLKSYYGWSTFNFSSVSIPSTIVNGNYQLFMIYKNTESNVWSFVRGKIGTPNFLNVTLTGTAISFSNPNEVFPVLTLEQLLQNGTFYQNKNGLVQVKVTNTGGEFNSLMGIYLKSTTNNSLFQYLATEPENIANNETKTIEFSGLITVPPGEYQMSLLFDIGNNRVNATELYQLGNSETVNILAEPTGVSSLSLANTISFENSASVYKSNVSLNASILNTGSYFEGKIIAFIFPVSSSSSVGYIGQQMVAIEQNQTIPVNFRGEITLNPDNYRIGVYYLNSSNSWSRISPSNYSLINFTLKDDPTAIKQINNSSVIIFPNPVTDILFLKSSENIIELTISDWTGKILSTFKTNNDELISIPVQTLSAGVYFLTTKTEAGISTSKFVKN